MAKKKASKPAKEAATKKVATKKVATKKVATKKVATKKVATKKVATKKVATKKVATKKVATKKTPTVVLLSGGNPQIAKGDGDAPVQAYIAAMPGWKKEAGQRLDALIMKAVPHATKAVRWNSPFYGIEGDGYFLGFHCITKYIKLAFFRGSSLRPLPPIDSKHPETRYLHIFEEGIEDEELLVKWIKQASKQAGWIP